MKMVNVRIGFSVLALVLAASLTGCGTGAVSADDVEAQASEQFSSLGPVDAVDCPEDLPAEVGASIVCTLESEGNQFEMTATVTSVEDNTVNFDLEITDEL